MTSRQRKHPPISWVNSQEHQLNVVHLAPQERRLSDYHIYKNFIQCTCLCLDDDCLPNWKRWVNLANEKCCGFLTLPLTPKKKETALGKAKMVFLGVVYQHLHGNGTTVPERSGETQFYVAYHHFHPSLLQLNNLGPVSVVSLEQGKELIFTDSDKLPAKSVIEHGYFPAPNYVMTNVELDLRAKERSAGINQQDCSAHSVGWKLPQIVIVRWNDSSNKLQKSRSS